MNAPVFAASVWTTILWILILILLILLVLYLVWLFTRKRRKEEVGRAEAAPTPAPAPPAEAVRPAAAPAEAAPAPAGVAAPAEAIAAPAGAPAPAGVAAAPAEVPPDDLTRIEGIGPKVAKVLASIGITTFQALAEADYSRVKQALVDAGWPYMDPASWMEQAKLAAEGRWEELALLQERLKGGRRQ
jgi:predicted flap endonuclease-1-like 5' DNA nuclease